MRACESRLEEGISTYVERDYSERHLDMLLEKHVLGQEDQGRLLHLFEEWSAINTRLTSTVGRIYSTYHKFSLTLGRFTSVKFEMHGVVIWSREKSH